MNGPQHYVEAERLIGVARGAHEDNYADSIAVETRLQEAQVHATLALVAASTEARYTTPEQEWGGVENYIDHAAAWAQVTS